MRKLIIDLCLAITSVSAMSATVKITSFVYTSSERKVAELCGTVSEMTSSPTFVSILVDGKSKRPATYNTIAGLDGKFCTVVVTYYGTAEATAL
ncbi:MAG: hypothetical protein K2Q18_15750 [Bdellovibrionales bacterium]|nr:hypothetical protein [Bdellovibrionales bacterium]